MRPRELTLEGFRSYRDADHVRLPRATADRHRRPDRRGQVVDPGRRRVRAVRQDARRSSATRRSLIHQLADVGAGPARLRGRRQTSGGVTRGLDAGPERPQLERLAEDAPDAAVARDGGAGQAGPRAGRPRLLGMDFDAFCRSVLLAQNRFAEFLTAPPAARATACSRGSSATSGSTPRSRDARVGVARGGGRGRRRWRTRARGCVDAREASGKRRARSRRRGRGDAREAFEARAPGRSRRSTAARRDRGATRARRRGARAIAGSRAPARRCRPTDELERDRSTRDGTADRGRDRRPRQRSRQAEAARWRRPSRRARRGRRPGRRPPDASPSSSRGCAPRPRRRRGGRRTDRRGRRRARGGRPTPRDGAAPPRTPPQGGRPTPTTALAEAAADAAGADRGRCTRRGTPRWRRAPRGPRGGRAVSRLHPDRRRPPEGRAPAASAAPRRRRTRAQARAATAHDRGGRGATRPAVAAAAERAAAAWPAASGRGGGGRGAAEGEPGDAEAALAATQSRGRRPARRGRPGGAARRAGARAARGRGAPRGGGRDRLGRADLVDAARRGAAEAAAAARGRWRRGSPGAWGLLGADPRAGDRRGRVREAFVELVSRSSIGRARRPPRRGARRTRRSPRPRTGLGGHAGVRSGLAPGRRLRRGARRRAVHAGPRPTSACASSSDLLAAGEDLDRAHRHGARERLGRSPGGCATTCSRPGSSPGSSTRSAPRSPSSGSVAPGGADRRRLPVHRRRLVPHRRPERGRHASVPRVALGRRDLPRLARPRARPRRDGRARRRPPGRLLPGRGVRQPRPRAPRARDGRASGGSWPPAADGSSCSSPTWS